MKKSVFFLSLPSSIDLRQKGKWSGIVKGSDNCLYCIPYNARQILKIDPSIDKITLVGEEYDDDSKWSNGFAHGDFVYGIPYSAKLFIKYNTKK